MNLSPCRWGSGDWAQVFMVMCLRWPVYILCLYCVSDVCILWLVLISFLVPGLSLGLGLGFGSYITSPFLVAIFLLWDTEIEKRCLVLFHDLRSFLPAVGGDWRLDPGSSNILTCALLPSQPHHPTPWCVILRGRFGMKCFTNREFIKIRPYKNDLICSSGVCGAYSK